MFSTIRRPCRPGSSSSDPQLDLARMRTQLLRTASVRRTQLLELRPIQPGDTVALQHRASVRRILGDIHAALDRMDSGAYGRCTRCGSAMAPELLTSRPWVARCEPCTPRTS